MKLTMMLNLSVLPLCRKGVFIIRFPCSIYVHSMYTDVHLIFEHGKGNWFYVNLLAMSIIDI